MPEYTGQSDKNFSLRSNAVLYTACFCLSLVILVVDLQIPLGVAGGVPYIAVVLVSLWSSSRKFTIVTAVICSILTMIGFFYSPEGGELWKVIFNRVLALFAIWVTALLSLKIKSESLEEIKVLKGLLPICASCKKIRDDNGYWSQLESYIHKHSEAEFSHGICPECFKELYPDIEPEKEN
jgi:hypothetical protein